MATMLVFSWHFMHGRTGYPVPFEGVPLWGPLVLFDEGHVGVALFMTLSGYLFSKLLDGKSVVYHLFIWNRILRLLPLLLLVIGINAVMEAIKAHDTNSFFQYILVMAHGFIFPIWPNGGWSIAVEFHFYLALPVLLLLLHRRPQNVWLPVLVLIAIILRAVIHESTGEVQSTAYLTIFGRLDQFIFGILLFHNRKIMRGQHALALILFATFISLYWWFDKNGGFFRQPSYPSPSRIWIVLPTLEGLFLAALIAWYDESFIQTLNPFSNLLASIGKYSYSIYLLHFFFVFDLARFINERFFDISNFYIAWSASMIALLMTLPLAYLSFRWIESPLLKLRRNYIAA